MTCLSSTTKKTNPLLPDLQLTAQPQLVSRVCLKCNFHIMPIIRWQLPAAFLLSPPHALPALFFKMPTSRCTLSDSCTVCKVELPRTSFKKCFVSNYQIEVFIQFWFPSIFLSCRVQLHLHKTNCLSLKIYKLQDSEFKKAKLKTSPRGNFEKRGTLIIIVYIRQLT